MSGFVNLNITIFTMENHQDTMVCLTTYLNLILLFMAFSDSERAFSRTKVARCLALVDFSGAVLSQLTPNVILTRNFDGVSVLLPYEMCFLIFECLAFNVNTKLLKLTQTTFRGSFQDGVSAQVSFRGMLRDNVFYHGVILLLSLVLVTLFFPVSLPMPLIFQAVMKSTLLRGVFFSLDGVMIYAVHALPGTTNEKILHI